MKNNTDVLRLATLFSAIPLLIFTAGYVAHEHPVYLWDWGGYFRFYQNYGLRLINEPNEWLADVIRSIKRDDYNVSTIVPLNFTYILFGESRAAYITSIVAGFILPTALALTRTSLFFTRGSLTNVSNSLAITALIVVLLLPPLWQSPLRGLPDVAAILPLTIATLIIVKTDFLTKASIRQAIVVGILVWTAFLFRRWFAFACLSLLVTAGLFALARLLYRGELSAKALIQLIYRYGATGLTIIVAVAIFQHDLALRVLTTSYSDIYSGYQAPFKHQLSTIYGHVGPFYSLLMVSGLIIALIKRNTAIIFCVFCAVLTLLLFSRTQSPSVQHIMPLAAWLTPCAVLAIISGANVITHQNTRKSLQLLIVALSVCVFFVSFSPRGEALPKPIVNLAPKLRYPPLYQENFAEYLRLIAKIKQLTSGGERIAVYASSGIMSDSLLDAIDPSVNAGLEWASQVDSRDGMRLTTLRAKYVIVTDPITLHLDPNAQKVISLPAGEILAQTGVGRSYKRIDGPYQLAAQHRGYIYERITPLSDEDITHLTTEFQKFYPAWTLIDENLIYSTQ